MFLVYHASQLTSSGKWTNTKKITQGEETRYNSNTEDSGEN